jgi:hypothetical protein
VAREGTRGDIGDGRMSPVIDTFRITAGSVRVEVGSPAQELLWAPPLMVEGVHQP